MKSSYNIHIIFIVAIIAIIAMLLFWYVFPDYPIHHRLGKEQAENYLDQLKDLDKTKPEQLAKFNELAKALTKGGYRFTIIPVPGSASVINWVTPKYNGGIN